MSEKFSILVWFKTNSQWIFSGIGVFALGICSLPIRAIFAEVVTKRKRKKSPQSDLREFLAPLRNIQIRYAEKKDMKAISELASFYLGENHAISEELATEWFMANNQVFRVIECRKPFSRSAKWDFCGFYSIAPLSLAAFSLLKQGKLQDYDITSDCLDQFKSNTLESLYIMDVMTSKGKCHGKGCANIAAGLLVKDLVRNIVNILNENPSINELGTLIASDAGRGLAKKFSFKRSDQYHSPLGWEWWQLKNAQSYRGNLSKAATSLVSRISMTHFCPIYSI